MTIPLSRIQLVLIPFEKLVGDKNTDSKYHIKNGLNFETCAIERMKS